VSPCPRVPVAQPPPRHGVLRLCHTLAIPPSKKHAKDLCPLLRQVATASYTPRSKCGRPTSTAWAAGYRSAVSGRRPRADTATPCGSIGGHGASSNAY